MAVLKKNTIGQILFTMVDKTDFASVESGLVSSDMTVSLFGVNHGAFAAASDILVSRAVSVVKSGIYKVELKAAEANFDYIMLRITAASAADQLIAIQTVTNDDEDINSRLVLTQSNVSDILSALDSDIVIRLSQFGDLTSDISLVKSALVSTVQSRISEVHSALDSDIVIRLSQFGDTTSDLSLIQIMLDSDVLIRATNTQLQGLTHWNVPINHLPRQSNCTAVARLKLG